MDPLLIFEKHPQWQGVSDILSKLQKAGHQALLAGGCVRDALMGRKSYDFDIASSATPDQVKKLFPQVIEVGRAFGVMIIPVADEENFQVEVTTFRSDGEYLDGRHPSKVEFSSDKEDALRRDFTMNALFYDVQSKSILDYVHGTEDIQAGIIRSVGDAKKRFSEDKLRILRAIRFVSQLGFRIDDATFIVIPDFIDQIHVVSKERVTEEFRKMISGTHFMAAMDLMEKTKLLPKIWPLTQSILNSPDKQQAYFTALQQMAPVGSFEGFLSLSLFVENPEQKIDKVKLPFTLSREEIRTVQFLFRGAQTMVKGSEEVLLMLNERFGPLLSEFCYSLAKANLIPKENVRKATDLFLQSCDENGQLPPPLVTGQHLITAGIKPSQQMGQLLNDCYMAQLRGEISSKAEGLSWVKSKIKK